MAALGSTPCTIALPTCMESLKKKMIDLMYYTCIKVRSTGYVCRNTRFNMVMFGPSCDGLLLEQQCQH